MWDGFIPQVHGKVLVHGPPTCGKVVFGSSDGPFCGIALVIVWWAELVLHMVDAKEVLEFLWAFIIQPVELRFEPTASQGIVDIGNGRCEVISLACLDGLKENKVAIVVIGN